MSKQALRFLTREQLTTWLEARSARMEKEGELPFHFEFDGEMLILIGTNNIGQPDPHNLIRVGQTICYQGAVDAQGHLTETSIRTEGEDSDIRIKGYIAGSSDAKRVEVISEDASIILGDPGHPERKLIAYAHIEAGNGINIYKRQLMHTNILNHQDDAIIRGQNIMHCIIKSPSLNINASIVQNSQILSEGDAMFKCSEIADSRIEAADGDIYLCAGRVRNTVVEAMYDIELNGSVDAFTLEHAHSKKGVVRHDGIEVGKSAPKRAAAKKQPKKATSAKVETLPSRTMRVKKRAN